LEERQTFKIAFKSHVKEGRLIKFIKNLYPFITDGYYSSEWDEQYKLNINKVAKETLVG
jgi:hypothetical protein